MQSHGQLIKKLTIIVASSLCMQYAAAEENTQLQLGGPRIGYLEYATNIYNAATKGASTFIQKVISTPTLVSMAAGTAVGALAGVKAGRSITTHPRATALLLTGLGSAVGYAAPHGEKINKAMLEAGKEMYNRLATHTSSADPADKTALVASSTDNNAGNTAKEPSIPTDTPAAKGKDNVVPVPTPSATPTPTPTPTAKPSAKAMAQPNNLFVGNSQLTVLPDTINQMQNDIQNNDKKATRGIAAVAALGNAPLPSAPGKTVVGAGLGSYAGIQALALTISHRPEKLGQMSFQGGVAASTGGRPVVRVGASYEF